MTRILVIEDTEAFAALVEFKLKSAGYEVDIAENGKVGLAKASASPPDLIVLDVMMPVMNGLETLKALKGNPALRTIPVLMLTAQSSEDEVVRGLELGADDYMTKPFSPKIFLARVNSILSKHPKA
jgi:DNA-binding response OmpR family regulator